MSAIAPGTRLGPYEVLEPIGAGAMGEVYRALDTRLKRQVALKVLPASVTVDVDRLARFQREAEVLASLNHPNIAALYGVEESDGVKSLVMELVAGHTLAERIEQGPIPVEESLSIARQIAGALAGAHELNIIHRDLKPANIKLSPDGTVKVLDFGIAKAGATGATSEVTSPALTADGLIVGTAAYMSPEQAAGRPVDRRTDLWAFGVVLFEMLTGRRLFDGESVSHVMAALLKDDPNWAALPRETPATIRKLLRRCLERDRRKRLADAATAALECGDAVDSPDDAAVAGPTRASRRPWQAAAGLVIGALAGGTAAWMLSPPPPTGTPAMTRFAIGLPSGQELTRVGRRVIALSPDASHLVYVADRQLYLRSFRELDATAIAGTAESDPSEPTFSPDGQWIAYWSNGQLKKIPIAGGAAMTLAEIRNPFGISWRGDRIVVGQDAPPAIVDVPANGGPATTLLALDQERDEWVQSPQVISDGRAVLFTLRTGRGDWNDASIVVHHLSTGARTTIVEGGTDGRVLAGGSLAYTRNGTTFVAPFDASRGATTGAAVPLQNQVLQSVGGFSGTAQMAWSDGTTMAYVMDDDAGFGRRLMWLTRNGTKEDAGLPVRPVFSGRSVAVSPDGKRVAVRIIGGARTQTDVWIGDFDRGAFTRLTSTGQATDPVWTPDGARVCYESNDELFCQPFDGAAPAQSILKHDSLSTIGSVSPDGAVFLLIVQDRRGAYEVWHAPSAPPHVVNPMLTGEDQDTAHISPDGRWIAYVSTVSGANEVYVRPYPATGAARWQVSTTGGVEPRWSRDGRELYYLAARSAGMNVVFTLTAVPILPGNTFATGPAVAVARVADRDYDVAPDGRFLITDLADAQVETRPARRSIVVVHNWPDLLRSRAAPTR